MLRHGFPVFCTALSLALTGPAWAERGPVRVRDASLAAPSALATKAQIEREALALRVLAQPAMRDALKKVEALYAADPQGATPSGKATIQRAAHSIAVTAVYDAILEAIDTPAILWVCNGPHDWAGMKVPRSGYGIDNPDNVYRAAQLDGRARYEIRGRVSRPGPIEQHFELRDSIPGLGGMTVEGGKQVATLRSDQMQIAPDGSFTITIDSDPANGRPNHMQTPAEGSFHLAVRDLFTDWGAQTPIALEIRRVSGPPLRPVPSEAAIAARAAEILGQIAPYWANYDNTYLFSRPANTIRTPRARPGGRGFSASGHFTLAKDEALVLTLEPLGAASLGVQLADPWGVAYEYGSRTSSLNNVQARPDADGAYTYVIAAEDPGAYNWLDPEGQSGGIIALRWQKLPEGARPDGAIRSVRVVKLAALKETLPAGTSFVTPDERAKQRAERAQAYARRMAQ